MRNSRKGFSLLEAAIVLSVIGIAVGAITIAMTATRQSNQASQLIQQTFLLIKNIREYYVPRSLPTGSADETTPATFTTTLRQAAVFPESMCGESCVTAPATTVRHSLGGAVLVNITAGSAPRTQFLVNYAGIPSNACTELVLGISTTPTEQGFVSASVNGGADITPTSVTAALAVSNCSAATNSVNMIFNIRS